MFTERAQKVAQNPIDSIPNSADDRFRPTPSTTAVLLLGLPPGAPGLEQRGTVSPTSRTHTPFYDAMSRNDAHSAHASTCT